jgi:hypothetical protein
MPIQFKHITYLEYEKLHYSKKPCSGACCFNKRSCIFCSNITSNNLMLDMQAYWVLRYNKENTPDIFALSFCSETCFNCWYLKYYV